LDTHPIKAPNTPAHTETNTNNLLFETEKDVDFEFMFKHINIFICLKFDKCLTNERDLSVKV